MPWVVGIDEAGYGPNLGPLVQAAVELWLPDEDVTGWRVLKPHVRRAKRPDDGRLLIDDSKLVYAGSNPFARLERGVSALLMIPGAIDSFLDRRMPQGRHDDLRSEPWFDGTERLPVEIDPATASGGVNRFMACLETFGNSYGIWANVVPTPRFNRIVAGSCSKAEVLGHGLVWFLSQVIHCGRVGVLNRPDDPVLVLCDKQGGRHYYAPLVQQAFPDGWVVAERESADESRYRVEGLGRAVQVVFRPRADAGSVSVALASMVAKYLREVCMRQFNRFWAAHVPGLKPTAGYPVDAKRFFDDIRPAMAKLGIPEEAVWRVR